MTKQADKNIAWAAKAAELNSALLVKDSQITSLNMQIYQMQHGIGMQLLTRYRRVVEKVLRTGTRRRYYYELLMKGIRVILNEGWRSFWFKFRHWLRRRIGKQADIIIYEQSRRYQQWILQNEPKREELEGQKQESLSFRYRPKISIVTPVWNPEPEWLKSALDSRLLRMGKS